MTTIKITSKNLAETLESGGIVLLDWWAPWCGPCRAFGPIFEKVAAANPDIVFGKINTEEESDLAERFSISSIPTLMVVRDKVLVYSEPGMLPERALRSLVEEVRKLHTEALRTESANARNPVAVA